MGPKRRPWERASVPLCGGNDLKTKKLMEAVLRVLKTASLIVVAVLTFAASIQPSAAMVIYPWCANYGGGGKGGYGANSCGFVSFQQCLATLWGNGGTCSPNPWYSPYPPPTTYAPPLRR